jgi:hypothetical protein
VQDGRDPIGIWRDGEDKIIDLSTMVGDDLNRHAAA